MPRCLGKFRGFESLNDRICKKCNEGFSEIDEQFCNSGPEAIIRSLLGIKGRPSHRKLSPFQRGSAGAERLSFRAKRFPESADAEHVEMDVDPAGVVRRLRQMILSFESRQVTIRITDDMKEPEQLITVLRKQGVEFVNPSKNDRPITALITGARPEEIEWMQYLLSGLKPNMISEPEITIGDKEEEARALVHASPTAKYFRALAKIGFHYFLKYMNGFHGSERAFSGIRDFITGGTASDVDRFVTGRRDHLFTDIASGESPTGYRHLRLARSNYSELVSKMQFFIPEKYRTPLYRPDIHVLPIYTIRLGINPLRIDFPRACSHSFTYSEEYKAEGYDRIVRQETIKPR